MRKWWYAAVGWTIVIAALCWTPRGVVNKVGDETRLFEIPNFDKLVHAGLFVGFAFLWLKAAPAPKRFLPIVLGGLALTVVTELGQLTASVNRDARFDDGVFDMLGVFLGGWIYKLWGRIEERRSSQVATTAVNEV